LADLKFEWGEQPTLTSAQYVQGVVAGHDHATRHLLDGIQKYVKEKPATPQEAMDRWGWLQVWLDAQANSGPVVRGLRYSQCVLYIVNYI